MVKTTSKVLTPNGSMGQNDDFEPLLDASIADFQSAELQVFNRWGERVHFENSASPRWDGKSPGGTVFPEGAYFYVLTVTKTDGSKYVHEKGALNILWAH